MKNGDSAKTHNTAFLISVCIILNEFLFFKGRKPDILVVHCQTILVLQLKDWKLEMNIECCCTKLNVCNLTYNNMIKFCTHMKIHKQTKS